MPHAVASFFRRTSNDTISTIKAKTAPVARARHSRDTLDRQSSYAISIVDGDDAAPDRMADIEAQTPNAKSHHKKHHRLSFSFGRNSKEHLDQHGAAATLGWKLESPPLLFHDDAEHSSGALLSGQLVLDVKDESLELDMLEGVLNIHVTQKRPFQSHCTECANQYTKLKHWNFLNHPALLPRGIHQFPFSVLLDGHLPASMDNPTMSIAYEFNAEAIVARNPNSSVTSVTPIKFQRVVEVRRCLPESDMPHHSVRIFPPTNIKAGAHYSQVLHPSDQNTVSMRLDGLTSKKSLSNTMEFWKLKKLTWRLEETTRTIAPACEKHTPGGPIPGGAKKGVERVETRVLGEKSQTGGWKADYISNDGHVEFEFDFGLTKHRHGELRYAGDSKSRDGTQVTHNLMVELVVSREWAPLGRPELCSQTGTGRILRMHYRVVVTEQPGGSVSWDNECPPVYQDVPPSPPAYPDEEDLVDYESLELLDAERNSVEGR